MLDDFMIAIILQYIFLMGILTVWNFWNKNKNLNFIYNHSSNIFLK